MEKGLYRLKKIIGCCIIITAIAANAELFFSKNNAIAEKQNHGTYDHRSTLTKNDSIYSKVATINMLSSNIPFVRQSQTTFENMPNKPKITKIVGVKRFAINDALSITEGKPTHFESNKINNIEGGIKTAVSPLANMVAVKNFKTTDKAIDALVSIDPNSIRYGDKNTPSIALNTINDRQYKRRQAVFESASMTGIAAGDENSLDSAIWAKPFGMIATQDKVNDEAGFELNTAGISFGADKIVKDSHVLGGSVSYLISEIDSDIDALTKTDITGYQVGLYGSYNKPKWFFDSMLALGVNQYESSRGVGSIEAKADYDGVQISGKFGGGYKVFDKDGFVVTPKASLRVTRLEQDGYTETNAGGNNLTVQSKSINSIRSSLGFSVKSLFTKDANNFVPEFHLNWLYDVAGDEVKNISTFVDVNNSYISSTTNADRHAANIGAGIEFYNNDKVSFIAGYDAEARSSYVSHTGQVTLRFKF